MAFKYGDKTDRSSYFLCKVPFTSTALFTRSWPTFIPICFLLLGFVPSDESISQLLAQILSSSVCYM
jgi:hypothetical protein